MKRLGYIGVILSELAMITIAIVFIQVLKMFDKKLLAICLVPVLLILFISIFF